MSKSKALENLLTQANENEQDVKKINSVVPDKDGSAHETKDGKENFNENENITVGKNSLSIPTQQGIDYFFNNLNGKTTEVVRITADLHKRIKVLATHSNTTITTIVNNILFAELDKHNTEIQKFIKKSL